MIKKLTTRQLVCLLFTLSILISCCALIREAFHPVAVGDETFSLALAAHSYPEIVSYTARDVHPPVYYFILKFIIDLLQPFSVSEISAGKLASALPYLILLAVSCTAVRKRFGAFTALMFSLCITGMAHMLDFGVNVRMYSWAMLFVTLAYFPMFDLLRDTPPAKRKAAAVQFILFSLLASYTHYFACIAVMSLYLFLFACFLCYDRARLKRWFLWVSVTCILYLPQLIIALGQIRTVQENYWIEPITLRTLIDYFQFLFNPSIYRFHSGTICGFLLFLTILWFLISGFKRYGQDKIRSYLYPLAGLFVPFFEIAFGVAASFLLRPVLVERYLFVSVGAMWLAFSVLAADRLREKENNHRALLFLLFLLFLTFLNTYGFVKREEEYRQGWNTFSQTLNENLQDEDVLLSNFGQVRLCLSQTFPDHPVCYYWRQKTEDLFLELYPNLHDTRDMETILSYLTQDNAIYYADTITLPEFHLQEELAGEPILCENLGRCLIEDTPVDLYRISRKEEAK